MVLLIIYRIRPDLIRDYDVEAAALFLSGENHRIRPDLIRDYD